jgi:hypothetical protein
MVLERRNSRAAALLLSAVLTATAALTMTPRFGAADDSQNRFSRPRISPQNRPTTSPYLNLLRNTPGSRGFASDYFLRVRPEQQWRSDNARIDQSIQSLQNQMSRQQQTQQRNPLTTIGPTGHGTSFFNHSHYYSGSGTR